MLDGKGNVTHIQAGDSIIYNKKNHCIRFTRAFQERGNKLKFDELNDAFLFNALLNNKDFINVAMLIAKLMNLVIVEYKEQPDQENFLIRFGNK